MRYIIFDLEATCWPNGQHRQDAEIIEIGAVLVDDYGDVISEFSRFVQPVIHPYLSPYCTRLTGIRQEQIDTADKFPRVIEDFRDWGNCFGDEYWLCSWGDYDLEALVKDSRLHREEFGWIEEAHIDLRAQYQRILGLPRKRGLKVAVEKEGFIFEGEQHRAIYDAINLVKIFRKRFDEWMFPG